MKRSVFCTLFCALILICSSTQAQIGVFQKVISDSVFSKDYRFRSIPNYSILSALSAVTTTDGTYQLSTPVGTTVQRPVVPTGKIVLRYNTDSSSLEVGNDAQQWRTLSMSPVMLIDTSSIANFGLKTKAMFSGTSPILYNGVTGNISIQQSSSSQGGYLSQSDWIAFNARLQDPGSNGFLVRTSPGITASRQFIAASQNVSIVNPTGVSGNPSFDINDTLTLSQLTLPYIPAALANADSALYLNRTTGNLEVRPVPAGSTTTANNGLSKTGTNAQLGQTVSAVGDPAALLSNREIPLAGFNIVLTGTGKLAIGTNTPASNTRLTSVATGSDKAISGTSASGIAISGTSSSTNAIIGQSLSTAIGVQGLSFGGTGVEGQGGTNGIGGRFEAVSSGSSADHTMVELQLDPNGTISSGIGQRIMFKLPLSDGSSGNEGGQIKNYFSNVTPGSQISNFAWHLVNAGVSARKALLAGTGQWIWDGYGSGFQTMDTSYNALVVDGSGNIYKRPGDNGGGGGGGGSPKVHYSVSKDGSDSLQFLNDQQLVVRGSFYGTLNDSTRSWKPGYWSFIDKYYALKADSTHAAVGGSSSVKLSNGTWLIAYVSTGSNPEDGNASTIHAINSSDNLRSFYNERQIVTLDTVQAHFGPSLYVQGRNLSTGDTVILIWATQIRSVDYGYVGDIRMRKSTDGGATWGSISILHSGTLQYYNNFPNRIFQTNSGKLLYPFEQLRTGSQSPGITTTGWDNRFLYSTDKGNTWTYSTAMPVAPDSESVESGFYQRKGETRLFWYSRSRAKTLVYTSYSDDDGVTWVTPDYMDYDASFANTTIKYVNSLDAYIGFSNRSSGSSQPDRRKYIYAYISYDGWHFKRLMAVDSVVDNASGVIGVSDIIDLDSSIVITYSELPYPTGDPRNGWANFKIARIPRTALSGAMETGGGALGVPSVGTADRIAAYIPNIVYNNNSSNYEAAFGTMFGYGSFLATGDLLDGVFPLKTLRLQSHSQIGRMTLFNKDAVMGWYGDFEFEKAYNTNYNMGAGQTVGQLGWNTVSFLRGITNSDAPGGFSNVDLTFVGPDAGGTTAERFRITSGGRVGIGTDAPATNLHLVGSARFDLGSDASYDVFYRNSSGAFTRLPAGTDGYVLTTHSTTSAPTWTAPSSGVTGSGTTDNMAYWTSSSAIGNATMGSFMQFSSGTLDIKSSVMTQSNNMILFKGRTTYNTRSATDADLTVDNTKPEGQFNLIDITANRTINLPTGTGIDGMEIYLYVSNTSGSFHWSPNPTLKKASDGTTVSTLTNGVMYQLRGVSGVGFIIVNQ